MNLFSCGGRADGGGEVTNSQLFDFAGGADPLALTPRNAQGQCLTVNGNVVGIAACDATDNSQTFTIGEGASPGGEDDGADDSDADAGNDEAGDDGEGAAEDPADDEGAVEDPADDEGAVEDPAADDETAAPGNDRGNNQGGGRGNTGGNNQGGGRGNARGRNRGNGRGARGRGRGRGNGRGRNQGQNGGNNAEDCGPGRVVTVTETVQAPAATETGAGITETAAATEVDDAPSPTAEATAPEASTPSQDPPAASATEQATTSPTAPEQEQATTGGAAVGGVPTANPTEAVPVSRAGGTLNPTAAAEAHELDETATRAFTAVQIRSPQGQCLFVDPTAGDFRQNLIPVQLVDCTGSPNEQFDVITAGKHNNANGAALIVSTLVRLQPKQ